MKLSERAVSMQASPIRKLMPYAVQAKKRGVKVYHLNIGQPDIETPAVMLAAYHNFNDKVLEYGPSQGLEEYRSQLVVYYKKQNIELINDEIIVTTAGSEAIIFAMLVAFNPGDEILVPEPFYTNYNGFATQAGVILKPITTYAETGFALPDDNTIKSKITNKTRGIMLCNPGNPTGTVYAKTDLQRLGNIALQHNLYIISDEVYREFIYDGLTHTSILSFPEFSRNAIMVDSVSKRYSACGARIGCIVSRNKELMAAVLKFAQARLCPPTIDQLAAAACVSLDENYFKPVHAEYEERRNLVFEALQQMEGVVCVKPAGAFYIIAKLPIADCEDFAVWMLNEFRLNNETVMFAPAEGFYATPGLGRNELRLAYILNKEELKKAMHIFAEGLKAYQNR